MFQRNICMVLIWYSVLFVFLKFLLLIFLCFLIYVACRMLGLFYLFIYFTKIISVVKRIDVCIAASITMVYYFYSNSLFEMSYYMEKWTHTTYTQNNIYKKLFIHNNGVYRWIKFICAYLNIFRKVNN